jgi:hypothetical protein
VKEQCLMMIELEKQHLRNVSDMRGNCLWISLFLLGLFTGFLYYGVSTLQGYSCFVCTEGMRSWV